MPTNLLLLPFLGGYWFLHVFYYTRFRSQRLDGYRLIVESALMGVVLTFLARVIVVLLGHWPPVRSAWMSVTPPQIPFLAQPQLRLLDKASSEERTVAISLDTGKVYVGLVAAEPNLAPHNTYLGITPFYSGYRKRETQELVFTVNYLDGYEKLQLDPMDFRIVVPMASIRVANFFDQSVYGSFTVESE